MTVPSSPKKSCHSNQSASSFLILNNERCYNVKKIENQMGGFVVFSANQHSQSSTHPTLLSLHMRWKPLISKSPYIFSKPLSLVSAVYIQGRLILQTIYAGKSSRAEKEGSRIFFQICQYLT
jgi:hypothetical protein